MQSSATTVPVLAGKVAIVTGAGRRRGIGRASAAALAELGADVVVTGTARDPATFPADEKAAGWQGLESAAAQVRALGRRGLALTADVRSAVDAARVAASALAEFGRIDILINNAAAPIGGDRVALTELSEEIWHQVVDTKLTGSFLMSRAVLPAMLAQKQGGSIVNISSIAGKKGAANAAAYCAACAGLQGFTQALAMEVAPHNIRVNAVCPGPADTARMDGFRSRNDWDAHLRQHIPLGRAAEDRELGRFIAALCSPDLAYITGQSLNFDGGAVMW